MLMGGEAPLAGGQLSILPQLGVRGAGGKGGREQGEAELGRAQEQHGLLGTMWAPVTGPSPI